MIPYKQLRLALDQPKRTCDAERGWSQIATVNDDDNIDDSDGACCGRPEPCHSTYDEDEGDEKDESEAKEGQKMGGGR